MNIRLMLVLALVVGLGFTMRDTIGAGLSLMTGRFEVYEPPPPTPEKIVEQEDEAWVAFRTASDARIEHWKNCTYPRYYEENQDDCKTGDRILPLFNP